MNASLLTTSKWLQAATKQLEEAGIGTARLDCLVLLEDATGKDRSWLLAHPDFIVQGPTLKTLEKQIARRAGHEPLAYIRGKTEFYGREFSVNKDVLEPRPESETIIDLLKQIMEGGRWKVEGGEKTADASCIIDIGTGCGCLAITAKLELPSLNVLATDISKKCLLIAAKNAKKLRGDVDFFQGNLLKALPPSTFHLPTTILANLPYVPDNYQVSQAAMNEPKLAIFGGPDGLDLYRKLFHQIANLPVSRSIVLTESLPFQHDELAKIANKAGYTLHKTEDFIQVFV